MKRGIIEHFLQRFAAGPGTAELIRGMGSTHGSLVVTESRGGATPGLISILARQAGEPVLVVTNSTERAESLTDGLRFFNCTPLIFPAYDTLPFETQEPVLHILSARNQVIARLISSGNTQSPPLIVAPVVSLFYRVPPADVLEKQVLNIHWGEPLDPDQTAARLVDMGFRRESLAESPGEFSVRGSIIDIYPPNSEEPWRLDLFGDEIEQIRKYDPVTQRSYPRDSEIENIEIHSNHCHAPAIRHLQEGGVLVPIFDLLPENTRVIIDGPSRIEQRLIHFHEVATRHWQEIQSHNDQEQPCPFITGNLMPNQWVLNEKQIRTALDDHKQVSIADLLPDMGVDPVAEHRESGREDPGHDPVFPISTQSFEAMPAKFEEYLELFASRLKRGHWIIIVCDNNGQAMRLDELLRENKIPATPIEPEILPEGIQPVLPQHAGDPCPQVLLTIGELHEGFHSPDAGIFIITDREMFGRYKRRHIYRKAYKGKRIADPTEIKREDFVVHIEHGIGRFMGIRRLDVDERQTEFLEIIYQHDDKLLVPVEKVHMVQKYASVEGKAPALDRLGSKTWTHRRKKSMEAVRKLAGEMLETYARREAAEGFAFGPDTVWQKEFEASFVYQETPDQQESIERVKEDMLKPRPMDRLVCGDVGYGKTEVAIRAAFKALVEHKQVAVLAPTTLLVQQHYNTFTERFADFPFRTAMLSRFRTARQQKEIIGKLKDGEVDIVIGTHRILSRDVRFKDLGLLIVDEEQRFGVAQKEKIKNLRADIDILTLTATPIPRTLYMALSGLRDLSVIHTPPANRHPIRTRTIRWDRDLIEEAILRELNRGGQVFFVHNRIETIEEVTRTVKEIAPNARVIFAHGQMEESQLEQIMIDFIDGNYDILVSTTIIENGIDIPNVNTIIINRADTFGLAQLYQLRGRVGRDVRQAYAYLILPPGQAITSQAIKRLETLEEFTELGVGFSIAMRDLEIRGTGNILGREQHGAITDIGYELYCRMLEEAVQELKGLLVRDALWPVELKWPSEQFLPEEYIPVESQRIRFYKQIAGACSRHDLEMVMDELVDRYGSLPEPAASLVNAARVRIAASPWRIDRIRPAPDGSVRLVTPQFGIELAGALAEKAEAAGTVFRSLKKQGQQIMLRIREPEDTALEQVLGALADYLEALPEFEPPPEGAVAAAEESQRT
jgi:transcription-repair coupling factor (superfamily II helicase)